jgi:hypothetical protein
MPRRARPVRSLQPICDRLVEILQNDLSMSLLQVSEELQYANQTVITQVKNGKTFPDVVRLSEFVGRLYLRTGKTVNLHWILTGEGSRFLGPLMDGQTSGSQEELAIIKTYRNLDPRKRHALQVLLGS